MKRDLEALLSVVAGALRVSSESVTSESDKDNLAAWDSLGHIQVIFAVESHFDVRFATAQIPTLTSIRALADALGVSASVSAVSASRTE